MNIFRKVENFLEEVDQQAASSLQRPTSTILSKFDGKKPTQSVEGLEKLGVNVKELGLDFDSSLELTKPDSLPESHSEPNLSQHINKEKNVKNEEIISDKSESEDSEISTINESTDNIQVTELKQKLKEKQKIISSMEVKEQSLENQVNILENQQNEILNKYKQLQSIYEKQKNQLVKTLHQKVKYEEENGNLTQKTQDLTSSLQTKDQLYSNLQLRFKQKTDECEIIKKEKDEWEDKYHNYQDSEKKSEVSLQEAQNNALNRITELENELDNNNNLMEEIKNASKQKESQLEEKIEEYSNSYLQSQKEAQQLQLENQKIKKELNHHKNMRNTLEEQVKEMKALENAAIHELNQKIENLSNKENSFGEDEAELLKQLSEERTSLSLKLTESEQTISNLNNIIYECENQMNNTQKRLTDTISDTNLLLQKEREKNQNLQKEMSVRTKQLVAARERNEQIQAMHSSTIKEKETEISKLSKQLRQKRSTDELEKQIQQLRENIEQKQIKIDTLSSENAALNQQRRNELQIRSAEIIIPTQQRNEEYEHDDNSKISERITPLMALAPSLAISDSYIAKKIVSGAKFLDGIATKFQQAFRTHPALRLSLILYIVNYLYLALKYIYKKY